MTVKFGIELEGVFNKDYLDKHEIPFNRHGWHRGSFDMANGNWKLEWDRSIDESDNHFEAVRPLKERDLDILKQSIEDKKLTNNKLGFMVREYFSNMLKPVVMRGELISVPFTLNDGRTKTMDDVFKSLKEYYKNKPLEEFFSINKSCGAHIHFSDTEGYYKYMISYDTLRKIRDRYFSLLKRAYPDIYKLSYSNYERKGQCDSNNKDDVVKATSTDRKKEFNLTDLNKGIEWRSFNLLGCKTWEEMEDIFRAVFTIIEEELNAYKNKKAQESIEIVMPKESLIGGN